MIHQNFDLDQLLRRHAERPSVISADLRWSYAELATAIKFAKSRLQSWQINSSEYIAVIANSSFFTIPCILSIFASDSVALLINSRFPPLQVRELLQSLACRRLITSEPWRQSSELQAFDMRSIDEFAISGQPDQITPADLSLTLDQPASIMFTSGSAGTPKAVLHSFGAHYYNALGSNRNIRLEPGDRWLLSLPLYHVGGLAIVMRAILAGAAVGLPSAEKNIAQDIQDLGITHISLVPTQLYRLLSDESALPALRSLKTILLGGGPIPELLLTKAIELDLPLSISYGSTEMASQIASSPVGDLSALKSRSLITLPYRDVCISDEQEILVRGSTLFSGYVKQGVLERPFRDGGWFATGDLGTLNKDGSLQVKGRKDNMFISGGENIQPEEIEGCLFRHPDVLQAIVVSVPDAEFGARPVAFVECAAGKSLSPAVLRDFLRTRIAGYKVPRRFFDWPKEDNDGSIKTRRHDLQRLAQGLMANEDS